MSWRDLGGNRRLKPKKRRYSMKRKSLKIVACSICGETDYADYMDTIDGKLYCQGCAEKLENDIMDKLFIQVNYDLNNKRR